MPVFTPTQVQGLLVPVRSPQIPTPNANPLNVLGYTAALQRNQALAQNQEQLDAQLKALALKEEMAVADNQLKLFQELNKGFSVQNAQTQSTKGQRSYGINEEFFPEEAQYIRNTENKLITEGVNKIATTKGLSNNNQALQELTKLMSSGRTAVDNNPQIRKAMAWSNKYDTTLDNIDKLSVDKNLDVNAVERLKLNEAMKEAGQGNRILRDSDFTANKYVFNAKNGQETIKQVLDTAISSDAFKEFAENNELALLEIKPEDLDEQFNKAAELAYNELKNNKDAKGISDNIAYDMLSGKGLSNTEILQALPDVSDAVLQSMIDNKLKVERFSVENTIDRVRTGEELRKQEQLRKEAVAAGEDEFGNSIIERELADIKDEIAATGVDINDPVGKESLKTVLRKVQRARAAGNNVVYKTDPNGDVAIQDETATVELGRFKSLTPPELKEGVDFLDFQVNSDGTIDNGTTATQTPQAAPQAQVDTSDDIALGLVEAKESSGGTNIININDASTNAPSIGPLQYNGELAADFLDFLGIEGFDVTKPLSTEKGEELSDILKADGEEALIQKSREFFNQEIRPGLRAKVNEFLPQANFDTTSVAVKHPLYSMAINHSPKGQSKILKAANGKLGGDPTDIEIINAVQDARIEYINSLSDSTLSSNLKKSLTVRYEKERKESLDLIANPPVPNTVSDTPTKPANPFLQLGKK